MTQAASMGTSPIPQGTGTQPFIHQILCPVVTCPEAFETSSRHLKDFASINNHLNDYIKIDININLHVKISKIVFYRLKALLPMILSSCIFNDLNFNNDHKRIKISNIVFSKMY